ncbi:hypothetical protein [Erwinia sp. SLM-02]|uniref:hypothetical protein n=1 Tax=Erwinia sp. SLM-02 TaxID=3020057 RepID=UPI0030803931
MRQDCAQGLLRLIRWGGLGLSIAVTPVLATSNSPAREAALIDAQEQLRQQERERVLREENTPQPDARLRLGVAQHTLFKEQRLSNLLIYRKTT